MPYFCFYLWRCVKKPQSRTPQKASKQQPAIHGTPGRPPPIQPCSVGERGFLGEKGTVGMSCQKHDQEDSKWQLGWCSVWQEEIKNGDGRESKAVSYLTEAWDWRDQTWNGLDQGEYSLNHLNSWLKTASRKFCH